MSTDFRRIIEDRRDGRSHSGADLAFLANGAGSGSIPDYQLAAWLMAAYLNPLSRDETTALTLAMADSGSRIDLTGLPKPWVDKHSTGGVGDKTSIVLLPLLAACGLTVVKMSGAGLGITGGTVDKLGSIPGFRLGLGIDELKEQARKIGLALTGQTPDLAPADKALYGLRDATATVKSLPLITSSILSKKVAGGAETVVLDVKCGNGAFVADLDEALELADWLRDVGTRCGLNIRIEVTDMSAPLGSAVGNAVEVKEAIRVLTCDPAELPGPSQRFRELCLDLAGETLDAVGIPSGRAEEALRGGTAAEKAQQWFAAQGGPKTLDGVLNSLTTAPLTRDVRSDREGWIQGVQAATVGAAVVDLGGGRHRKEDLIDPSVGIEFMAGVGDEVRAGDVLFTVHAGTEAAADEAAASVRGAMTFSGWPVERPPLVLRTEHRGSGR